MSAKEVLEGNVEPPAEFEPLAAKLNEVRKLALLLQLPDQCRPLAARLN